MTDLLIERYPSLAGCKSSINEAIKAIIRTLESGGTLLLAGNGGSAADCDHIVGELTKGFLLKRALSPSKKEKMKINCPTIREHTLEKLQGGLRAISLPSITALNSAFCNDVDPSLIYAQGVFSLGREGDALIAISTSGNSENVLRAAEVASGLGMTVISLTGEGGGAIAEVADIAIKVPERETYRVQELHLPVYHAICAEIEQHFFGNEKEI